MFIRFNHQAARRLLALSIAMRVLKFWKASATPLVSPWSWSCVMVMLEC